MTTRPLHRRTISLLVRMAPALLGMALGTVSALPLSGCTGPTACTPGESRACTCANGASGAQVCNAAGTALGACACGGDVDAGGGADVVVAETTVPDGAISPDAADATSRRCNATNCMGECVGDRCVAVIEIPTSPTEMQPNCGGMCRGFSMQQSVDAQCAVGLVNFYCEGSSRCEMAMFGDTSGGVPATGFAEYAVRDNAGMVFSRRALADCSEIPSGYMGVPSNPISKIVCACELTLR